MNFLLVDEEVVFKHLFVNIESQLRFNGSHFLAVAELLNPG